MQLQFCKPVEYCCSCFRLPAIHPHIQVCIKAGGESSFRFIKLITGHAEICKNTIHLRIFMQPQKTLQVTEILSNKYYPVIRRHIRFSIFILIKNNELTLLS